MKKERSFLERLHRSRLGIKAIEIYNNFMDHSPGYAIAMWRLEKENDKILAELGVPLVKYEVVGSGGSSIRKAD